MSSSEFVAMTGAKGESELPPDFVFSPDILEDYEEQVRKAHERATYQAEPVPSFEDVLTVNIVPTFNPTAAPVQEIYARNRVPDWLKKLGDATHFEPTGESEPVEMWRIVERERLRDGTGLVSSRVLHDNTIGNVEKFDAFKHFASNHERRSADPNAATPFVSFSTDPRNLAERVILHHGFGVKDGRDSVVVRVRVDPSRVITAGHKKEAEVLLIGGVAPEEYEAAYEVSDFVTRLIPDGMVAMPHGQSMNRDEALQYWRQHDDLSSSGTNRPL